ncbi:hypothetical protein MCOR25_005160 [Pyricularia grisea]|uniref:Alpha/beta hydrolase fold-3 domain-containing protein n=1 Tax=Pyricularia grisea TaxID=148305 RepID=A0A6P8BHA0_PYRGI|nr:uncharacterized protein PgNI_01458 [Pyricularia grisea]KAI6366345.1 hypothetical protein MCOR25_005160 [Pyricularia grisea]TLD15989.1 hypothetical protein PgNI_01458 [Pyricularia grisea]
MGHQQVYPQPPYPLHDSIRDKLDPDYVEFYNKYLLNAPQVHYQPVAASRVGGKIIPGGTDPVPVGKTIDVSISRRETAGPDVRVRAFVPAGQPPSPSGWPVFVWYHGGGWVLGNIDSENSLCSNVCARARCVVVTTDFRLAPEHPFPAAVHDAWEAALWVVTGAAATALGEPLDLAKVAVGGSSAGGNLAAVVTHKALRHEAFAAGFKFQLLVVPVMDNTASMETSPTYAEYEHTAALPVDKMLWYRRHYLPDQGEWSSVEASPLLADADTFAKLPPALVVVAGLDVLRWEGEEYARRLRAAGVDAEVKVFEGVPHPFIVMDAVLQKGKEGVDFVCERLAAVLA